MLAVGLRQRLCDPARRAAPPAPPALARRAAVLTTPRAMPRQAAASDRAPASDDSSDEGEEDTDSRGGGPRPRGAVHIWRETEDATLAALVAAQTGPGPPRWAEIASRMPGRRGKQCRDRYVNHLAPNISRAEWSDAEERALAEGYLSLGSKWAALARLLPGRTENMVRLLAAFSRSCHTPGAVLLCACSAAAPPRAGAAFERTFRAWSLSRPCVFR